MSKSNSRRVKSLDDIPETFKRPNPENHNVESKISKVSSEDAPVLLEEYHLNQRNIIDPLDDKDANDDRLTEGLLENSNTPKIVITKVSGKDTKTNPLEAPNFVDDEGKYSNDTHKSTDIWGEKLKSNKRVLSLIDTVLSMFLITPMSVGFWRGTWTLMDLHIEWFPGVLCYVLGTLVHMNFAICKNFLHSYFIGELRKKNWTNKALIKIVQIVYTYVFGVACNVQWRGGWIIFDYYFSSHLQNSFQVNNKHAVNDTNKPDDTPFRSQCSCCSFRDLR